MQDRVQGDLAVVAALAVADDEMAFAGRGPDVVEVEGDDLADAQPGVEADRGDGAVAGLGLLCGS